MAPDPPRSTETQTASSVNGTGSKSVFAETLPALKPKWYEPRGTSPLLIMAVIFLLSWTIVISGVGIYVAATISAHIDELGRREERESTDRKADKQEIKDIQVQDKNQIQSTLGEHEMYIHDMREKMIRAGIFDKQGQN